ncbi:hypothetical protein [Pseudolysinimonas sp.]|uniref:hypothetical protein n=1 Tax=Pseudolysinimonas sp. TaxID=2680009 RepID=UPI003F8046ED
MTPHPDRDIGLYLGVVGRWAWVLFGVYCAVYLAMAVIGGAPTAGAPVTAVSLGCVILGALLIASPSPTPLPWWRVGAIGILGIGAVLVMYSDLPTRLEPLQVVTWQLGAVNFILFVLELRGRILAAWVITTAVLAISVGWSLLRTGAPWLGVNLSYGQAVSLVAGTIFAIGLQRAARLIFAQQDAERARAAEEAALKAGDEHRAAELADVRSLAGPLLQRIAAGEDADPTEALALEAALRDRIRGRALAVEPLLSALERARARGVDALLLDDLGDRPLSARQSAEVAHWCAERLEVLAGPRATIRIAPGEGGPVVSIADADGIVGEHEVGSRDQPGSADAARRDPRGARAS